MNNTAGKLELRKSAIKATVQCAVRVKSSDRFASHAIDIGEGSPDEHLAIVLHYDRIDGATTGEGSCALKVCIQSAVEIEPRNIGAAHAVDRRESASDKHLAVSLHCDRRDIEEVDAGKSI